MSEIMARMRLKNCSRQTLPLSVFLFRELSARVDLKTSEGRAKLVQDARPLLHRVAAPGLALMLLKRLAEISGFSQKNWRIC